jgi:hypothetical protein
LVYSEFHLDVGDEDVENSLLERIEAGGIDALAAK